MESLVSDPDCCEGTVHVERCLIPRGFERVPKIDGLKLKCYYCLRGFSKEVNEMYAATNEQEKLITACFYCIWLQLTEGVEIRSQPGWNEIVMDQVVAIFADGGLLGFKKHGGTWAWCGVDKEGKRVLMYSGVMEEAKVGYVVTNNHSEQMAILQAIEMMPPGWSGNVYSDSFIALGRVFHGFRRENLPDEIHQRSMAAVKKLGTIKTGNLKGHPFEADLRAKKKQRTEGSGFLPTSIHNYWCDKKCEEERDHWKKLNGVKK